VRECGALPNLAILMIAPDDLPDQHDALTVIRLRHRDFRLDYLRQINTIRQQVVDRSLVLRGIEGFREICHD
jgi:hypothetical protein